MRLRRAIKRANDALVAGVVAGGSAEREVRRQLQGLQTSLYRETVDARQDARLTGRSRLEVELDEEMLPGGTLPTAPRGWELDDAAASVAAQSLTAQWGAAALGLTGSEAPVFTTLPRMIDGRVVRTASTEVASAFNHERDALLVDLGGRAGGQAGLPDDPHDTFPRPGLFKVYSAVLDRVTCQRCFGADGEIIEATASFKAGAPPLHPFCRCIVEHIIIRKTERIEDISIDYDLFKQELRDVIREQREISDRRALAFVSDSLGPKRSAEVLAKRFHDEAYATRLPTTGRVMHVPPTGRIK